MLAVDIMTPDPATVRPDDPVEEALLVLQSLEVRHLPVVSDDGVLVGMLSDRDLRALPGPLSEGNVGTDLVVRAGTRVGDLMSTEVISVATDADVSEVIEEMIDNRIGAVPVVDFAKVPVGIVSYIDILRAVADVASRLEPTSRGVTE